jgi:hypothetical protein
LFISQTSIPRQPKARPDDDDFAKITRRTIEKTKASSGWTLGRLCQDMQQRSRDEFLATKYGLAMVKAIDRSDGPLERSRRVLENFLAWWVFTNRYLESLAPRSARQIVLERPARAFESGRFRCVRAGGVRSGDLTSGHANQKDLMHRPARVS